MQNYIGKQIDRYRIIDRLGMGGMAVVYKAYDTRLERDVALKLIRTGEIPESQHERLMKRFEREAKSQARFQHRNIVPIYDYGEADGSPYLVMAYISGGTLKERLQGPVDWRQAVRWLIPVAEALGYAHQRGVIHRDVKTANILFDEEGQPILTDFGIAKILETDEATLTGTGMGVGTPEYMAPEQWLGKTSEATDQYALGVVLYELITGKKPYHADTPAAIILMQANEPLQAPSKLVNDIPEALEKILYKALAKNPQDRYEGIGAFQAALAGTLMGVGIKNEGSDPTPIPTPRPVTRGETESDTRDVLNATPVDSVAKPKSVRKITRWIWWVGGSILLVLLSVMIGVGGNLLERRKGEPEPLALLETKTPTSIEASDTKTTSAPTKTAMVTMTPDLTLGVGAMLINNVDRAEMMYVPAGEFLMGSEADGANRDEAPEHKVYLDAYWIYKDEVTNAHYRQCIEEGVCEGDLSRYPENDKPAVYIDWYEATDYCEWVGGRLPTEAEWEKAARGEDGRTYPWGDAAPTCNLANYSGCGDGAMTVGSYPDGTSPYGAMDMAGNVWEWMADWYGADYYGSSPGKNPSGPPKGDYRVLRGGSWDDYEWYLRTSFRFRFNPDFSFNNNGFRCLRSP